MNVYSSNATVSSKLNFASVDKLPMNCKQRCETAKAKYLFGVSHARKQKDFVTLVGQILFENKLVGFFPSFNNVSLPRDKRQKLVCLDI